MTIPRTPAELTKDLALIDALLAETPVGEASADDTGAAVTVAATATAELRNALLGIRSLAHGDAPEASPELARHFVPTTAPILSNPVASLGAHRRKRAAFIGLTLAATVGLGVGAAAAASPDFRDGATRVFDTIGSAIVSTVTGNQPTPDDVPTAPSTPRAPTPSPSAPTDSGRPTDFPAIPNPSDLINPGKRPAVPAIPGVHVGIPPLNHGNDVVRPSSPSTAPPQSPTNKRDSR